MALRPITFCLSLFVVCTIAAHVPLKPVYERSFDNAVNIGNPLAGSNPRELNRRAQIHIQNQQERYNAEKFRKQKAMAQKTQVRSSTEMDSYVKAYQEQHEVYQKDLEKKQSKQLNVPQQQQQQQQQNNESLKNKKINVKDTQSQQPNESKQVRSKRVHNENDLLAALNDYNNQNQIRHVYGNSNGFVPIVGHGPSPSSNQQFVASQPLQVHQPQRGYSAEVESLTALIGKQPKDQLKGFNELLKLTGVPQKVTHQDLYNSNVNIKASNLDEPIKKYDYAPPSYGYSYQDYVQPEHKDHTPITENVHDVADITKPVATVSYYYPKTKTAPATTHASNYYKVEVANHVVDDHTKSAFNYLNEYNSGFDNLHYASQYEFGYRVKDHHTGNDFGHQEYSDGESAKGEYHVLLPDGRLQKVKYVADPSGYHADVSYH